jgi:GNAT superfamily N-acetyltransferase
MLSSADSPAIVPSNAPGRPHSIAGTKPTQMSAPETYRNGHYDVIDPAHTGAAIDLIARTFSRDEPLALTVGQSHDEFSAMLGVLLPAALPEGLTMGAYVDQKLVGVALTTAFTFTPPPEIEGTSPNYPPIGALIEELERDYELENTARLSRCAHIHMLAIAQGARGRGIAQALVEATAGNARSQGFDAILSNATNPTSQQVFAKQGFETLNEVRYDSFEYSRTRRFASIANLGAIKLVEKRL